MHLSFHFLKRTFLLVELEEVIKIMLSDVKYEIIFTLRVSAITTNPPTVSDR